MSRILIALIFPLLLSCDPFHQNKCEWFLVAEPRDIDKVQPGWVPLCARNYKINKQRCWYKSKLKFAKAVHKKKFRLSEIKVAEGPFPKTVLSIKPCR